MWYGGAETCCKYDNVRKYSVTFQLEAFGSLPFSMSLMAMSFNPILSQFCCIELYLLQNVTPII